MARQARARRPDDARLAEAFGEQWRLVSAGVDALSDAAFDSASRLPGWTVGDLVAHCARSGGALAVALSADLAGTASRAELAGTTSGAGVVEYLGGVGARAEAVADTARSDATGLGAAELRTRLRTAVAASAEALTAALGAGTPTGWDRVVNSPGGPIRLGDFVVTRCVEGVVHGLDLGFTPARDALRIVTRALVDLLAARAPGRSVEVRVPPFAAVQVVEGPRHTRGTPPNVVEADPVAFVEVAAGRLDWATALAGGRITASGDRADLRPWLPLL
ncbi:maleylpyruvate isomerase N-terminal domain-containing protein [Frankia sp. AgB1.9]|uniref:sterol carrier family protein n=1 Tax=unclassified Frankia TaxID=2632575 RepID=UPI001933AB57|nr:MULTISPECIES: sterol carrier family protein [unclassified Frankia]MBL7487800.1 maleylpyruvate isomerase N-terminal domain-containing protein [Frankia sp. AgW1.1]MBL7547367.1 maleylpyruvate isomerase N-terminal domain-containing protein [Frankia sp. AgB1.9]MBL7624568.1 maleylpyruvate isomerase N-terminal domain-containing protein [Frankia sp. AgB1.8]